jgi:hypothetical protein
VNTAGSTSSRSSRQATALRPERLGPVAGLLSLSFLVFNLVATRAAPEPDTPTAQMVAEILDHRNAYVASAALILAQGFFLLVFAAALGAILGRGEGEGRWLGGLAALGGSVAAALAMASGVALLVTVFTADHEPTGVVWAPLVFHTFFLTSTGVALAVFMLATGLAAISARALPRVLAWACIPIGLGVAFGGLYGFGGELDGGVFGTVWFLAGLGFFLWTIATSVFLLRLPAT